MKVVLLGGAGYFGRSVITDYASRLPEEYEYVIADYDYRTARKMAKKLGDRFTARMVDASSPESFDKAARDASVIVSIIGPWYRFGEHILMGALRSSHPLVLANICRTPVAGKKGLDFVERDISCITGVSLIPGALALIAESLQKGSPGAGKVAFTLSVDTANYGGLAFIREYFSLISEIGQAGEAQHIGDSVTFSCSPAGLFQKLTASLRTDTPGVGIELISSFQHMARRGPRPGQLGCVTLDLSIGSGEKRGTKRLGNEKLFPLLSAMLAGATHLALEMDVGGVHTLTDISRDPLFVRYVDKELQELFEQDK